MKVLSIAPGLFLVASGGAFAQSKSFEGYSLSLGGTDHQLKVNSGGENFSVRKTSGNIEFTNFTSLDDNWLLGVGVGLDFGSMGSVTSGSASSTFYDNQGGVNSNCPGPVECYEYSGGQSKSQFSQNSSISVIPAYAFNKNSLGFLRVSFNSMKAVKASEGGVGWVDPNWVPSTTPTNLPSSSGNTGSKRLTGWGFGLGYRFQSEARWFAQVEYRYVAFKKNDYLDLKPSLSSAVLSVGYTF